MVLGLGLAVVMAGSACNDDSGNQDTGPGADGAADSAASGDSKTDGVAPTGCTAANLTSVCGAQQSIVRVVAKLKAGMPDASGNLLIKLYHLRLGNGSTGGAFHTETRKDSVTIGAAKPVEVHFDMCSGSAMWSEENCEFNLWAFVDKNGNNRLDPGEPAARKVVSLSCHAAGPACHTLELGCTSGMSCVSFTSPGTCSCSTPSCNSDVKTCQ
jgi:hypothetical protein